MGIIGWVAVGVAAWVALSVPLALLVGRALRVGRTQRPRPVVRRPRPHRTPTWQRHAAQCAGRQFVA